MRPISKIIIHCAATRPDQDIGVKEIRTWHHKRGWLDIGYHAVIRRTGLIEFGRPTRTVGAHVRGHNEGSLGICLVGGYGSSPDDQFSDHFTDQQKVMLIGLIKGLQLALPYATIHGHNEFADKACPGFRVGEWLEEVGL